MKIAFFEVAEWMNPYMENLKGHELYFTEEKLSLENAAKFSDYEAIVVFIYSTINKAVLEKMPNLKFIATMSTGFDHIDISECKSRGISVCNVPAYGENTVAEHTFALILSISRKIPESIERSKKGDFDIDNLKGFDLKGKTLGVIGCGKIGQNVARIAIGFGMNVLVYDVYKNLEIEKQIGFKYEEFENVLKNSDIITLHTPYNSKTHHLINKNSISMVKKGTILINTARGGLIETEALLSALDKGVISAVGLDVLEGECFIKEESQLWENPYFKETCDLKTILQGHILLKKPNVYITPHNAFNSNESMQRIIDTTIKNIQGFINNQLINII